MKRCIRGISIAFVLFAVCTAGAAHAASCINWPRVMAMQEIDDMPSGRTIVVNAFEDFTKIPGDGWLVTGIRDYLTSCMRSSESLKVISGGTVPVGMPVSGADYTVGGKFQHLKGSVRIFISLSDMSGKLLKQFALTIPYPNNREFFTQMADSAAQILEIAGSKYHHDVMNAVKEATASTHAYESYSKGRDILRTYDPKSFNAAKRWFDDTKRIDFRSPLGYEGMIDLYTFLGFYHRQNGTPFSHYYQMAQKELLQMTKLAKPAPLLMTRKKSKVIAKQKTKDIKIDNKFILNNISYQEGLAELQAGHNDRALKSFRNAVDLIPEDAISWYYISEIEGRQNNRKQATDAMAKAQSLNPCIRRP